LIEHDLGKPLNTFPDHALGVRPTASARQKKPRSKTGASP
jgi:hypothetical protein